MSDWLQRLLTHHPSLTLNFTNSAYPAASFNFGPSTVCYLHTDTANDTCNWCHITALGNFNPTTSRHIVIRNLKAIFEFPAGSSTSIPLAIFEHGNTPIQLHKTRQSFTQYCAGGLLRWVDCGFRTLGDYCLRDPAGKAVFDAALKARVDSGIQRFSPLESLLAGMEGASGSGSKAGNGRGG